MSLQNNDTISDFSDETIAQLAVAIPSLALPAALLCIPPLLAHLKARNFAASILTIGVAVMNLLTFVNALIWKTNNSTTWNGEGLCDVEVKLYVGLSIAVVGATTSIFRQLAIILDTSRMVVIQSSSQRRWKLAYEYFLCIFLPSCAMAAHYIVQPERYWLVTILGCAQSFDRSWPSYVLNFMWPVLLSLVGAVYCSITVYRLVLYRRQVSTILSSRSSISKSRFARLFALALALLVAYFPLAVYTFVENLNRPRISYSWQRVHEAGWSSRIERVPLNSMYSGFDRWVQIGTGWVIFGFFGLGHEAVSMYKSWLVNLGFINSSKRLVSIQGTNSSATRSSSARSPLITGIPLEDV